MIEILCIVDRFPGSFVPPVEFAFDDDTNFADTTGFVA